MSNKLQLVKKLAVPFAVSALLLAFPLVASAQILGGGDAVNAGLQNVGQTAGYPTGGLAGLSNQGPVGFIANIIDILLIISGAVAVLFVVIGGFWYITAGGNAEQAKKGRTTVVNALIGIVIIILSYVIVNVIVSLVSRT